MANHEDHAASQRERVSQDGLNTCAEVQGIKVSDSAEGYEELKK